MTDLIRHVGPSEPLVSKKREELARELRVLETKRHSTRTQHYPSGSIRSSIQFYDGEQHGVSECWYECGRLKARGEFRDGALAGQFEHWYENGDTRICGGVHSEANGRTIEVFMKGKRRLTMIRKVGG